MKVQKFVIRSVAKSNESDPKSKKIQKRRFSKKKKMLKFSDEIGAEIGVPPTSTTSHVHAKFWQISTKFAIHFTEGS